MAQIHFGAPIHYANPFSDPFPANPIEPGGVGPQPIQFNPTDEKYSIDRIKPVSIPSSSFFKDPTDSSTDHQSKSVNIGVSVCVTAVYCTV